MDKRASTSHWKGTKRVLFRRFFEDSSSQDSPEDTDQTLEHSGTESWPSDDNESLPPLTFEVVHPPNKHDDSPEFYEELERKMKIIYRQLFIEKRSTYDLTENSLDVARDNLCDNTHIEQPASKENITMLNIHDLSRLEDGVNEKANIQTERESVNRDDMYVVTDIEKEEDSIDEEVNIEAGEESIEEEDNLEAEKDSIEEEANLEAEEDSIDVENSNIDAQENSINEGAINTQADNIMYKEKIEDSAGDIIMGLEEARVDGEYAPIEVEEDVSNEQAADIEAVEDRNQEDTSSDSVQEVHRIIITRAMVHMPGEPDDNAVEDLRIPEEEPENRGSSKTDENNKIFDSLKSDFTSPNDNEEERNKGSEREKDAAINERSSKRDSSEDYDVNISMTSDDENEDDDILNKVQYERQEEESRADQCQQNINILSPIPEMSGESTDESSVLVELEQMRTPRADNIRLSILTPQRRVSSLKDRRRERYRSFSSLSEISDESGSKTDEDNTYETLPGQDFSNLPETLSDQTRKRSMPSVNGGSQTKRLKSAATVRSRWNELRNDFFVGEPIIFSLCNCDHVCCTSDS